MSLLFNNPAWSTPAFNPNERMPQQKPRGLLGMGGNDLLALGQGLLSMSGPSRTPTSFGQALGAGVQNMQAQRQQEEERLMQQQLFDMKRAEHDYKMGQGKDRKIIKGGDGFNYYADTKERVLPGIQAKPGSDKLVKAIDPKTGLPRFVRESEAEGMQPYAKALVENNVGGELPYKVPNGYMLQDPNDPSKGVMPIPGGNKDSLTTDQAGKTQMLRNAENALANVESLLFNDDGTINQMNVVNASTNTPYTSGRRMRAYMEQGIQAITRAETGAAMPATEIDNTRIRFQPSPLDDDETKIAKYEMFKEFLSGSLSLIDPSGRFNEERFNRELKSRGGKPTPDGEIKKELKSEKVNEINTLIETYAD